MKWLYWIGGLLLAAWFSPFGILWKDVGTWRFRTVLAVETPEGVREASSVLEARQWFVREIQGGGMSLGSSLRGEAVFLDLPGGRNLVMLVDKQMGALEVLLLGKRRPDGQFENKARPGAKAVAPPGHIPTLVTFPDVTNPASAQVVYSAGKVEMRDARGGLYTQDKVFVDRFTALYGPGYALKEVRLEMVSAGLWPFNLLPIPFPQALFGTPITSGIEGQIKWMDDPKVIDNPGWMNLSEISRNAINGLRKPYR